MAVFVQWVTDRAVQIDSETGLTSLSLELAQEAISALPAMDVSLLEFVNRTQLFLFFLDASLSLASPSLLDSSPQPFLTLSDWMHYSTHEIIQSLFTIPTIDVEKVVECTLHLNGLKADAILGFITDYHGQDKRGCFSASCSTRRPRASRRCCRRNWPNLWNSWRRTRWTRHCISLSTRSAC